MKAETKVTIRIPQIVADAVKAAAVRENRSGNSQYIQILEDWLSGQMVNDWISKANRGKQV